MRGFDEDLGRKLQLTTASSSKLYDGVIERMLLDDPFSTPHKRLSNLKSDGGTKYRLFKNIKDSLFTNLFYFLSEFARLIIN